MLDLEGGRISAEDVGYGYGFRLNYHQTIAKKTIGTTDYYEYTDADGTRCYFYYDSEKKEWKDELGKDLTLKVNGSTSKEPYVIEGKDHSRMVFGKAGHLIRITDQNANQITVTFGKGDRKITAVTDGAGRVAKLAYFTDADGKQTRVKTLTAPDGRVWGFAYTDGKLTAVTDPDGKKSTYAYDSKKLLTSVKNFDGYELRYTYDTRNPYRVKKIAEYAGETAGKSLSLTYGYNSTKFTDNKNRSEIYRFNNSGNLREEREYDYTTDPVSGTPKKLTTAVMDETWKDKLLKWGSTGMTYDACGNMLKKGDATFTWTQGRKLSAINNGKNIRYYYDHTGARVKKVVDGVTTEYRMAGSLLVSERTGDETIWYQYDSAASLVAMIIGGTRYNYVRNAQNDIVGLIDSTGKRVVYYKYDSWGRAVNISGTMAATVGQKNPFRYRGYYFDSESGMYYLQSRYYDPEIRRFISADNIIVTGTSVEYQNVNLYEYCSDNPINFQDPSGHFILSALAGAGAYFFEAIVSLGASYLLTKEIAGVVDEFAWYRKSQKEKRDEALLSRVITRDLLKQDYDYWAAELKPVKRKMEVLGGEPLTVEEACLRVSQQKSVMCRNEAAAWYIIIANRYFNAVGPEKHDDDYYSHYHPTRNHTGYLSVHIWFFD
ncbi:MAG: RHS repeat-associated core domain-containing protein [Lachnospiraceae bacterium]|nr:RHS repeat-associated core domain-containing protein [Lachnospiraceae bacterium]